MGEGETFFMFENLAFGLADFNFTCTEISNLH